MSTPALLEPVCQLARAAGAAIMEVYQQADFGVTSKDDDSPLTRADIAAHHIISQGLVRLTPDWPLLSEEAADISWNTRRQWQRYWLVDPLDGTKEFIKRNGEFTVNIALIENGIPVLGVVYAPVLDWLYVGARGVGASKQTAEGTQHITVVPVQQGEGALRVVASRTHRGAALDAWLEEVGKQFAAVETVSMGSSLKICLVAEGAADIYPRLAPTSEWDTAAAQAVLEAAGGKLVDVSGSVYRYNCKEQLLNPEFFAVGDVEYDFPTPHTRRGDKTGH
jgi:3'(2'), 5'-bisphosphate nucleotidase